MNDTDVSPEREREKRCWWIFQPNRVHAHHTVGAYTQNMSPGFLSSNNMRVEKGADGCKISRTWWYIEVNEACTCASPSFLTSEWGKRRRRRVDTLKSVRFTDSQARQMSPADLHGRFKKVGDVGSPFQLETLFTVPHLLVVLVSAPTRRAP